MAGTSLGYAVSSVGNGIFKDDDADSVVFKNFTDGPSTLLLAHVESANAAAVYLSIWNKKTPTGGSDGQDYQFPIPANGVKTFLFERGAVLSAAGSYFVTTGKGSAASGNPATPPDVYFVTSANELRAAPTALSSDLAPADPTAAGASLSSAITQGLAGPPLVDPVIDSSKRLASASAITVFSIQIDNSLSTVDAYFKIWNVAAEVDVTLGTTAPDIIVRAAANLVTRVICPQGMPLATGLVYACVTERGSAGTVAPTVKPTLEMLVA